MGKIIKWAIALAAVIFLFLVIFGEGEPLPGKEPVTKTKADIAIFCLIDDEGDVRRADFMEFYGRRCGLILDTGVGFGKVSQLKEAGKKVIFFTNAYFAGTDTFFLGGQAAAPERVKPDWVLRAKDGSVIKYSGPLYFDMDRDNLPTLLDIRHKEWQRDHLRFSKRIVNDFGYDGIFEDTWISEIPGWASGPGETLPKDYTKAGWQRTMDDFTELLRRAFPDKLIFYNGITPDPLGDGQGDRQYLSTLDGASTEAYSIYLKMDMSDKTKQAYFEEVIMGAMLYVKDRDKYYFLQVSLDESNRGSRLYALTAFLLNQYDKSFFYAADGEEGPLGNWFPEWSIPLGKPQGEYYRKDDVYLRDFEQARVVVNPTTKPVTIAVSAGLTDIDGGAPDTVILGKFSGTILRKYQ